MDIDGGSVHLLHASSAVPGARRALVHDLERDDVADAVVADVAVVVSELLGNAVRHGAPLDDGGLLLRWRVRARDVAVAVVDGGGGELVERPPSSSATGGRGLGIVAALSERWGSSTDDYGCRTVWASVATGARLGGDDGFVALPRSA